METCMKCVVGRAVRNVWRVVKEEGADAVHNIARWATIATALLITSVLGAATGWAQGGPLIVVHSLSPFGAADSAGGPITTFDFGSGATVATFVPPRSAESYSGHGVAILDNEIYYTHLSQGDRFT